ncbi:hypothetical protein EXIGLDRAFT_749255 [Exidia glandulosa HHB12029]|uniref:Transmembrane protein n=1 Tax=Exidia glandulosa HHB12029 TaxID=1314781 RepID=A0A165ICU6_EXIGL|nr:hypothetical protein EXIGLDRAFT_749255 [Exidia glandulosa HHB12029]
MTATVALPVHLLSSYQHHICVDMDGLELSEENPAPRKPAITRVRFAMKTRREAVAGRLQVSKCFGVFLVFLVVCHGFLAGVVFFYSQVQAYPLPHGAINRTKRGLAVFTVFAYLLGAFVGLSDSSLFWKAAKPHFPSARSNCCVKALFCLSFAAVWAGIGLFFAMSPLIFSIVQQNIAYEHACKDDWITVLFTGHRYDAANKPNTADFALSTAPSAVLFTFTSQNPDADKFGLVRASLDLGGGSSTSTPHPELRNITYNFDARTFSGLCFGDDSTTPCATGTYDDCSLLTFNVSVNGTQTVLRSLYDDWTFGEVILYRVDASGALVERMIQTAGDNCPTLKVCIPYDVARSDSVIAADVLVALGMMLYQQGMSAVACTTPSTHVQS